jgi:hypothetical protein
VGDRQPGPWEHLVITLITVAGTAIMVWWQMPPAQRQMMTLEARRRLHRVLAGAALRSGRAAMRDELEGRAAEAGSRYALTYRLSRLRDGL